MTKPNARATTPEIPDDCPKCWEELAEGRKRTIVELESALRAAREERDRSRQAELQIAAVLIDAHAELDDEREARKQTEVEQFNAGIEAAAIASCSRCRSGLPLVDRNGYLQHEYHKNFDYRVCTAGHIRALSKPVPATSQPPSQPTGDAKGDPCST